MKILDKLFGNKIQIVIGYSLYAFAEHEQTFIFHKKSKIETIESSLYNYEESFKVRSIKYKKTKKIISPKEGYFRPVNDRKVVKWYD